MSTQQQANQGGVAVAEMSMLDQILDHTNALDDQERDTNKTYIEEFLKKVSSDKVISKDVAANINYWIAELDKNLSAQLNEVMHNEAFQKLEGTWRGLHYLTHQSETGQSLKIRVMNVNKKDLLKDLEKAVEFDQSTTFKKVYEEEYGQLGGQPYGMLVGDFHFGRKPDDINLLKLLSNTAAAATIGSCVCF